MQLALYRKYRPVDFSSVVGQNSIKKTLQNSILDKNFSHAYLFFGSRGTGKTTLSKIFARTVNCLNLKNGEACGKCDNCLKSFENNCPDIIEIDAASNNGVDEIRELRNNVSLVPSELLYKVYIIDEVHMLSTGAFNALLKTLEEPPEHSIFILATTDLHKVPSTIVSRCQTFSFEKISSNLIFDRLKYICKNEKIKCEEEVLKNIAILSEGGLRDAIGMLDKLKSFSNDSITMNDFEELNGLISNEELFEFLEVLLVGNISEVLKKIERFDSCGKNLIQISIQLLTFCRNILVDYYMNGTKYNISMDNLNIFANILNENMFDIKRSDSTKIYFELFILKFINDYINNKSFDFAENNQIEDVLPDIDNQSMDNNLVIDSIKPSNIDQDVKNIEKSQKSNNIKKSVSTSTDSLSKIIMNINEIVDVRINNTLCSADKKLLTEEKALFEKLKDYTFDSKIGYLCCSLLDANVRAVGESDMIISFDYDSVVNNNLKNITLLTDVYRNITGSKKNLAIISDKRWEEIKKEYINNKKSNIKYSHMDEPEEIFEEIKNDDIISSSAINLFGDIVEVN